ncbi:MAG: hypothetical protein RM338_34605 [Nostoc sp. DedQUE12a]|nr:hypothetical protein [Nostoc sp. DedQUE12a]
MQQTRGGTLMANAIALTRKNPYFGATQVKKEIPNNFLLFLWKV